MLSATRIELRFRLDPAACLRQFHTDGDAEQFSREQLADEKRSGDAQRAQQGLLALARSWRNLARAWPAPAATPTPPSRTSHGRGRSAPWPRSVS